MSCRISVLVMAVLLCSSALAAQSTMTVREGGVMGTPITDNEPVGGLRDIGFHLVSTQSSPLTISVTNTGGSPINFGAISKTGADPGDFYIQAGGFPSVLQPFQTGTFDIVFYRTTSGISTCTVELPHNATGAGTSPFEINLKGTAYIPMIVAGSAGGTPIKHLEPAWSTSRDFGSRNVFVGPTSPITLFLTNGGTGSLTISAIDLVGSSWSEFVLDTSGTVFTLSGGQTTSFTVAFDPSSVGTKDAQVRITHSEPTQPSPYLVPVTGMGTYTPQPVLALFSGAAGIPNNGTHNAGSLAVATASNLAFSIANPGNLDLNLTGTPAVVISYTSDCGAIVNTAPALTISPVTSTNFSIDVTPIVSGGAWSFKMVIANDDPYQNPYTVTIQGTATVAATEIRVITQPVNATAGQIFSVPPVIAVTDAAGLVDTNDNTTQVAVAISSGTGDPSAVLSGTLTVTAAGGYLAFTDLAIDLPSSGYTLTFTNVNGALGTAISDPFDVTGGAGGGDGGEEENKCSTGPGQDYAIGALLLLCALTLLARRKAGA